MITTLNDKGWIAIEVPEGAKDFVMTVGDVAGFSYCKNYNGPGCKTDPKIENYQINLPPGSYAFCFLWPGGVTLDWVERIVKRYGNCYKDYMAKKGGLAAHSLSGYESFRTLMQSKGCDNNKNYAICQKKSQ
jgi:hypothetical protein